MLGLVVTSFFCQPFGSWQVVQNCVYLILLFETAACCSWKSNESRMRANQNRKLWAVRPKHGAERW